MPRRCGSRCSGYGNGLPKRGVKTVHNRFANGPCLPPLSTFRGDPVGPADDNRSDRPSTPTGCPGGFIKRSTAAECGKGTQTDCRRVSCEFSTFDNPHF